MDAPVQKIIDLFICRLRKKLADASAGKDYFETVRGRGYMLRAPSEDKAVQAARGFEAKHDVHRRPAAVSNAVGHWRCNDGNGNAAGWGALLARRIKVRHSPSSSSRWLTRGR